MKRILASLVVVVTLFAGLATPIPVRASAEPIYLNDQGWSEPSVGTWDPATRTATLQVDLTDRYIELTGDGITLDGNGHTLSAVQMAWVAVSAQGNDITVRNVTVMGAFTIGIVFLGANGVLVGNRLLGVQSGIVCQDASDTLISGNTVEAGEDGLFGIYLFTCTRFTLRDNSLSNGLTNFALNGPSPEHYDHDIDASNLTDGKRVYYIKNATGQVLDGLDDAGTVYLVNCDNMTVRNLSLTHNGDGVCLVNTHNSQVENIQADTFGWGVRLISSNNNVIAGNTLTNNETSIGLDNSTGNTLSHNTTSGAYWGIHIAGGSGNRVEGCTTTGNHYGLHLENTSDNRIYGNWFLSNTTQAYVEGGSGNLFNLPASDGGGNYWSDWTGPDADGDGFVDSPYVFTGGQDDLPLCLPAPTDTDAPHTTIWGLSGMSSEYGWWRSDVQVSLTAIDIGGAGVQVTEYSFDGANWATYTGPFTVTQEGVTTVYFRSTDNAGNVEEASSIDVKIDKTLPVVTRGAVQGVAGNDGWYLSDVTVPYTASDALSGLANPADASFVLTASGEGEGIALNYGWLRLVPDRAGNEAWVGGGEHFNIDKTAPVLTQGAIEGEAGSDGWYRSDVTITFSATDAVSGLAGAADASFALAASGEGEAVPTGTREVADVAGNVAVAGPLTFKIDKTPPVVSEATVEGVAGDAGWYRSDVQVTLAAVDNAGGSGVASIEYSFDGATWVAYEGPLGVTQEGTTTVYYRSIDNAGNVGEPKSLIVKIDKTAPVLMQGAIEGEAGKEGWYRSDVAVAFSATDGVSGLAGAADASFELTASGEGEAVSTGTREVADVAGNVTVAGPLTFKIDMTPPVLTWTPTTEPNAAGWYNHEVVIDWTASDALSGLDPSCCPVRTLIGCAAPGPIDSSFLVARDLAGNEAMGSVPPIQIDCMAPAIAITTPEPSAVLPVGMALEFDAADDLSGLAMVTATLDDGTGPVPVSSGDAPAPGVYTLVVQASDRADNVATEARSFVVYDPDGGAVSGKGWIDTPAGAYVPAPELTGKASFAFAASYESGSAVPGGQAEFELKAANLSFSATGYTWLVVTGAKAQCEGVGTINGTGSYGFLLTVVDGKPDRLRIKIWDEAGGDLVYDNQLGAADNADPAAAIGGGTIVVHAD